MPHGGDHIVRKDALFIAVEVDDRAAADTELARRLTEACPVDIFAQKPDGSLELVEQNLDECVLCRLCLDAVESDPTHPVKIVKLYDNDAVLA
jgi:ferredoxin-like protein FixX